MRTEKRFPFFGSVSSGTMRTEDLVPAFMDVLGELDPDRAAKMDIPEDLESDEADFALDELFDVLNEYAPPYFYFGAHPGDGADYGFWLSETFPEDFDGLRVSDLSEVPDDYSGEVLFVNDHGNISLYSADKGKLTEVWAVV